MFGLGGVEVEIELCYIVLLGDFLIRCVICVIGDFDLKIFEICFYLL